VVYTFDNTHGCNPEPYLTQGTDGKLYGLTNAGGAHGNGTFFSLNVGLAPFASLLPSSGKVGSRIGILGQGFSSSSIVKFNGVKATTVVPTGTTFLLATVPAGASDGKVTVTTGTTTLTSAQTFVVHNSWSTGAAMPIAVEFPAGAGVINGKIYVVGRNTGGGPVSDNQIYNPSTNTWTTGAALPIATYAAASAVVNNVLYIFGGTANASAASNAVWAYNPTTNAWTAKAAMPTARFSIGAVVENNIIYVIGGNGSSGMLRLNTVESYHPATNTWTAEAPLLVGKSEPSVGLVGTTIVAADGYTLSQDTGDNEGYNASTNTWRALMSDPTLRNGACYGSISGQLYVTGGWDNAPPSLNVTSSFSVTSNKWTTQTALPHAVTVPGSAVNNWLLYCIGGTDGTKALNYVQIYQP
jgi:N-acetylneuraminic acid mutarotase